MSTSSDHGRIRSGTPTTYYDGQVRIPGYGDAPERCRDYKPVGFCEHGHTILGRSSCGTRYCPDHWRDWCEEAVINMVARLGAYREAQDGWDKRMVHAVASPPQDRRYSRRELWDTRSDAYEAFQEAGGRGGAVITHPYRTTEEANALYASSDAREEGVGKWRWLRDLAGDLPGDDWEELEELVEPSPHYHALLAVEDLDGSAAPSGWVVKNIRSFEPFQYDDAESYEDMVAAAYYVLTHGAVQQDRTTLTYFGAVHPNAFDPAEALTLTKWRRIQMEAERAVKGHEEETEESRGCGGGPEECPHEDCEAVVLDMMHLPDRLDDDEWVRSVRVLKGGRRRLKRLRGALAYWEGRTDRPPPSARASEVLYLEWLERRGRSLTPEPRQSRLSTA